MLYFDAATGAYSYVYGSGAGSEAGVAFDLIRPWSWESGSVEAVRIEADRKSTCGEPRRYSLPAVAALVG